MIRYALACAQAHEFESWFPSASSYDAQAARGLVACPVCGSADVRKQIMAPAVAPKGRRAAQTPSPPPADQPAAPQPVALMSEREQALRAMLRGLRDHVVKNADDVGRAFPEEARRMHYGEIEHRSIYGEADAAEAKALVEEGIEIHALPVVPDDRN